MIFTRTFPRVHFQPVVVREAFAVLKNLVAASPVLGGSQHEGKPDLRIATTSLLVERGRDSISHDEEEQFFADYRRLPDRASFGKRIGSCEFRIHFHNNQSDVSVECPSRSVIDAVLNRLEEAVASNRLPDPPPSSRPPESPKIFVGHGHSGQWRELKEHLTDKHNLDVIAYEVGARAGHTIRDILDDMLSKSTIAFLVLTGEDRDDAGLMHARENVIHETGLFQGRLGFSRAIVLLENGTVEFSNIHGIEQLRFSRGNIKEVFGDVVAVIRREFESPR